MANESLGDGILDRTFETKKMVSGWKTRSCGLDLTELSRQKHELS